LFVLSEFVFFLFIYLTFCTRWLHSCTKWCLQVPSSCYDNSFITYIKRGTFR